MTTLLVGAAAIVGIAALAFWSKRRSSKKLHDLEPGRVVIASNLVTSRRR